MSNSKKSASNALESTAKVICMNDVKPKKIQWLWPNRIPSKGTLIAGDPGQGKSQVTIALAATITKGGTFPDGQRCKKGSVIFIACEDDPADTIKPRLDAAGADSSRVHVLDHVINSDGDRESWSLTNGIPALAGICDQLGDVALIVVDPISAYLGGKDSHSNADVRGVLAPLMALADEYGTAVLMISHLNKATGSDAMTRVNGSGAFVAATRAAFLIGKHPDIDGAYAMATLKTNLSRDKSAIGYRVVSATTPDGIETSKVEWIDGVLNIDADQLLSPAKSAADIATNTAKGEAVAFIMESLRDGPRRSVQVKQSAERSGIAESTLKRAKKLLAVRSIQLDGEKGWFWSMPAPSTKDEPEPEPSTEDEEGQNTPSMNRGPLDTLEPLRDEKEGQEGQEVQGSDAHKVDPLQQAVSNNDSEAIFL